MLAMRTRSAWRAKMFRFSAARIASRRLFCCTRKPGLLPGKGAYQAPHSSTTKATFFFVLIHNGGMLADQSVHRQREFKELTVLGLAEVCGCEGRRPLAHRVRVHRKTIDIPAPCVMLVGLHDGFGPFGPSGLTAPRAYSDLQHLLLVLLCWIEVAD